MQGLFDLSTSFIENNQVIVDNIAITCIGAIELDQTPCLYSFYYNNKLQTKI